MSWSYSGDPLSSSLDSVRFEIGDTDVAYPLFQDEEILAILSKESNDLAAAARCCEILARKFARDVDNASGPIKVAASQRYRQFTAQARDLRRRAVALNTPYAGGISKSELTADAVNTDLRQPLFTKDMMSGDDI